MCGCGALGSVIAETLVRAGAGFVRIVDRDFLELNNLQRQVLYDEQDVADGLPKAIAAANKLRAPIIDRLDVDRHKAETTGRAAAKSRGGDLGALDDKQRGDIVIAFDVDRDILAEPATVLSVAAPPA